MVAFHNHWVGACCHRGRDRIEIINRVQPFEAACLLREVPSLFQAAAAAGWAASLEVVMGHLPIKAAAAIIGEGSQFPLTLQGISMLRDEPGRWQVILE